MKWWPEKNPFSLKKRNIEIIMDSSLSATKKIMKNDLKKILLTAFCLQCATVLIITAFIIIITTFVLIVIGMIKQCLLCMVGLH